MRARNLLTFARDRVTRDREGPQVDGGDRQTRAQEKERREAQAESRRVGVNEGTQPSHIRA